MLRRGEQRSRRDGFTVVELLVSLGVISLLMAILMPAVQSARESSRRIECANRLKQIMLGTEAFASNRQRYPEYSSGGMDRQGRLHGNVCPLVEILPYVDRADVYQRMDRGNCRAACVIRWIYLAISLKVPHSVRPHSAPELTNPGLRT